VLGADGEFNKRISENNKVGSIRDKLTLSKMQKVSLDTTKVILYYLI
jgi:hypothetical protein